MSKCETCVFNSSCQLMSSHCSECEDYIKEVINNEETEEVDKVD